MTTQTSAYYCGTPRRRALLADNTSGAGGLPIANGIDYLEVNPGDQTELWVFFIHPLPGEPGGVPQIPLESEQVQILGGVRVEAPEVISLSASGHRLTVTVAEAGDFSLYELSLTTSPIDANPPAGFDTELSKVSFSFKVNCRSDFDCRQDLNCTDPAQPGPAINYLARDFVGFRRLMLDRMSSLIPGWGARSVADAGVTVVEVLAHAADQLSYYQDAVASEAYLGTARRRRSVRRHSRLLDYRLHDGCNARTWVSLAVAEDTASVWLPRVQLEGDLNTPTRFCRRIDTETFVADAKHSAVAQHIDTFEPLHDVRLYRAHNTIRFYSFGDEDCCLARGATSAVLRDNLADRLRLRAGDVLVFEEHTSPVTGEAADRRPSRRQAVRLTRVEPEATPVLGDTLDRVPGSPVVDPLTDVAFVRVQWHPEDALSHAFCLNTEVDGLLIETAHALGNIVLADHGLTKSAVLEPTEVPNIGAYRPMLNDGDPTHAEAYVQSQAVTRSANASLVQDARRALPTLVLTPTTDVSELWEPRFDLLASGRFDRAFVLETADRGPARLRFGDGIHGRRPPVGTDFVGRVRFGNGERGNVGADSLVHLVGSVTWPDITRIEQVRNPLPATTGVDPESTEHAVRSAPYAFLRQERAVTADDYSMVLQRHSEVLNARATLRWTGSWHTVFVAVDRIGGRTVDRAFEDELVAFVEAYRTAGHDVEIEPPSFVPLDLVMTVCIDPTHYRSVVGRQLESVFSSGQAPDGVRGFFHPDNFTFGQPVILSQVVATAMEVPGVHWVDLSSADGAKNRFGRRGDIPNDNALEAGMLTMERLEIARCDSDASRPENGVFRFLLEGGL